MNKWTINKDGYTFNCDYDHKNDIVTVNCFGIDHSPKSALAKASGPELIANLLAGEIIKENIKK